MEALAPAARWNSDDPSAQHQSRTSTRTSRRPAPYPSLPRAAQDGSKRTDEQVTTVRANRANAEARREARAQNYQSVQSKQKEAEKVSETELEEQHEIRDNDAWEELNRLTHDDELEDPFDHMLLDMDTSHQSAF